MIVDPVNAENEEAMFKYNMTLTSQNRSTSLCDALYVALKAGLARPLTKPNSGTG